MIACSRIHLEIAKFVLMCRVDIRVFALHNQPSKFAPPSHFQLVPMQLAYHFGSVPINGRVGRKAVVRWPEGGGGGGGGGGGQGGQLPPPLPQRALKRGCQNDDRGARAAKQNNTNRD